MNFIPRRLQITPRLLLWVIGLPALCAAAASWIAADYLIAPAPSQVKWPANIPLHPTDVSFTAMDGVHLQGWFLSQSKSTQAVVLLHGVRANRDAMLERALWLHTQGYNVLLYDSRGCGTSDKSLLSFGSFETRDLLEALSWLQSQGITSIACIGCSQGAATILLASAQLPSCVHAIIAEAPYATLRNTVDDHFRAHTGLPSRFFGALTVPIAEWKLGLNVDDVSPLREIFQLKAPLYLIGGTADHLAPVAGLQKLYAAATGPKSLWLIQGAGHVDFFSCAPSEYKKRIGSFLVNVLSP